jgi:hypothetical protein
LVRVRAHRHKGLALVSERTADIKLLKFRARVKNRIPLFDLDCYAHRLFAKFAEQGGFFVSRRKESADLLFLRSLFGHRGQVIVLEAHRLSELLFRRQRRVLNAEAEPSF